MLRGSMVAALFALALAACGGEDTPAVQPTLTNVQAQIFDVSCTFSACHAGAAAQAGLDLTGPVHAKLLRASTEDPARQLVVAGSPDTSFLMDKVLGRNLPTTPVGQTMSTIMPPGSMLEAERIALLRAWIAAGAQDD